VPNQKRPYTNPAATAARPAAMDNVTYGSRIMMAKCLDADIAMTTGGPPTSHSKRGTIPKPNQRRIAQKGKPTQERREKRFETENIDNDACEQLNTAERQRRSSYRQWCAQNRACASPPKAPVSPRSTVHKPPGLYRSASIEARRCIMAYSRVRRHRARRHAYRAYSAIWGAR